MKRLILICTLGIALGLVEGLSVDLERNAEEVEDLLDSLKKLETDLKRDKAVKSSAASTRYEGRKDVFDDTRYRPVYNPDKSKNSVRGLTQQERDTAGEKHNSLRAAEGGSNMYKLYNDDALARLAQTWADQCVFEHGQPSFDPNSVGGHKELGQNIWMHTNQNFDINKVVQDWFDEKKDYHYDSASCNPGAVCGHYTAVVWAGTTRYGCGMTKCDSISGLSNAFYVVCNYAPPGNWANKKPYLRGPVCTQCEKGKFYCNGGLCDDTCSSDGPNCQCSANCKNGATKTGQCGCTCAPGFSGPDCGESCSDKNPKCGLNDGSGWPSFTCDFPGFEFVKAECPKMCNVCSKKASTENKLDKLISMLKEEVDDYH